MFLLKITYVELFNRTALPSQYEHIATERGLQSDCTSEGVQANVDGEHAAHSAGLSKSFRLIEMEECDDTDVFA